MKTQTLLHVKTFRSANPAEPPDKELQTCPKSMWDQHLLSELIWDRKLLSGLTCLGLESIHVRVSSPQDDGGQCGFLFVQQVELWDCSWLTLEPVSFHVHGEEEERKVKVYLNDISHRLEVSTGEDQLFILLFLTLPLNVNSAWWRTWSFTCIQLLHPLSTQQHLST